MAVSMLQNMTGKKMARDKNLRPCLPLKPQEKKLICVNTIANRFYKSGRLIK
jgi:hypothetical protein